MHRLWSFLKIIHLWFETCFDLFWRKIHTRHPAALYVNWIKWKTFFCFYLLLCNIVYFLQMCLVLYNTTLALCLFLLWRILYAFHDVLNAFIACFTAILHLFASSKLGRNIIFSWLGHIFYCDRTQVSRYSLCCSSKWLHRENLLYFWSPSLTFKLLRDDGEADPYCSDF